MGNYFTRESQWSLAIYTQTLPKTLCMLKLIMQMC